MINKVAYHNTIIDDAGIGTLAAVTVYLPGTTTLATIYSNAFGAVKVNPFNSDTNGRFVFYADAGEYDIKVSGADIVTYTLYNVSIIGVFSQFVTSSPPAGERAIKRVRLDASGKIVVVHDSVPAS